MGSLDSPYWRLVMIVDGMLCLVLGVLMVFYFEESPRFQLCSSYYTQAFESINRMIIGNNSGKLLESEEVLYDFFIFLERSIDLMAEKRNE